MPISNRLTLSIAGTAAVALASLPLGISPANAARVTEGTTSSIGVVEDSSNAQQFNIGKLEGPGLGSVAQTVVITPGSGNAIGSGIAIPYLPPN